MNRAAAACCYVPVPGVAVVVALACPRDRLVRFHAWQATVLVLFLFVAIIGIGYALAALPSTSGPAPSLLAGLVLVVGLILLAWGAIGAARGHFVRLPLVAGILGACGR